MDRMNLFPVPLFGTEFEGAEELKNVLVPKFLAIEEADQTPAPYTANGYTNYNPKENALDFDECAELKEFILECGRAANQSINCPADSMLVGSWFSINRKHSYHPIHNHVPATWSGVYYVQAEEDDAYITFFDDNKVTNWPWAPFGESNEYNTPTFSIMPRTGRLLLFPSFLKHTVEQQIHERERMTISFNLSVK